MEINYWSNSLAQKRASRRRILKSGTAAGVGLSAAALAACGGRRAGGGNQPSGAASPGQPKTGGTFRMNINNDPFDWT